MILQLEHIDKEYRQGNLTVPVLHDINLTVQKGDYLAIMGPSGSGKSTLMNLLGCLDTPTRGTYLFEGEDLSHFSDNRLADLRNRAIGFVFQRFNLLPRQSALDNVALPLLYAGVSVKERRARAVAALEKVGLSERMNFRPNQLSGGQSQRVAIARAIVTNPTLLLADEPTGALDTASGEQVMEIFRTLHAEGTTIVMITHEAEIAAYAEQTRYIRDGILSDGKGDGSDQA